MRIIVLSTDTENLHVNIDSITYFIPRKIHDFSANVKENYTEIGIRGKGNFNVNETPEEIIKLILQAMEI